MLFRSGNRHVAEHVNREAEHIGEQLLVRGIFVMAHKIQVAIGICSIVSVVIAVKILIWIKERNELVKVPVNVEDDDNR